jgi:hypothetical protein
VCKRPCECFKSKNSAISSIAKKDERRKLVSGGDCQGRNCAKTKNAKKIVAQNRKTKKKKKKRKSGKIDQKVQVKTESKEMQWII